MRHLLAIVVGMACLACGPGFDEFSGKDAKRSGAREIPFGEPVDDRVSAEDGDNTDWKTIALDAPAQVTVRVWWDQAADVDASVTLRDKFSRPVAELRHRADRREEVLGPIDLPAGDWLLEVLCRDGASVYTLELRTAGAAAAPRPGF